MTATNGTEVALHEPQAPALVSDAEIDRTFRIAKALAMSGMFKDSRQAEQAFAKILVGRDLGLSPTQAMMGIHIVEGKPELSANLQAAFVKRSPHHDYRVITAPDDDDACEIAFYFDGDEIGRSRFTMDDARKAGLAGRGPWKSYPRNMLFARAISNGVAFHCPEVTGGLRVYSEGEISGDEQPHEIPDARATLEEHFDNIDTDADPHGGAAMLEPPEAEVIDEAEAEFRASLVADAQRLIDAEVWTGSTLKAELVGAGAQDTSTVGTAIASLSHEQADAFGQRMSALLPSRDGAEA